MCVFEPKKSQKNRKRPLLVCVFEHEISNFKVDFLPIFSWRHKMENIRKYHFSSPTSVPNLAKSPYYGGTEICQISNFKVDFLPIFPVDHKFSKIKKINLGWFKSVQSFIEIREPFTITIFNFKWIFFQLEKMESQIFQKQKKLSHLNFILKK